MISEPHCGLPLSKPGRENLSIVLQDCPFELVKVPILALSNRQELLISGTTQRVILPAPLQPLTLVVDNVVRIQTSDLRNYAVILFQSTPELEQYRRDNALDVDDPSYVPHAVLSENLAASPRQRSYVSNLGSTMYTRTFTFDAKIMVTYRPVHIFDSTMQY